MSVADLQKELMETKAQERLLGEKYKELEIKIKITRAKELVDKLESYKFDYDPNTVKYEDCTIEQLMYLMYLRYGPNKKWMDGDLGNGSIYEKRSYWTNISYRELNEDEYKQCLIQFLRSEY